MKILRTIPVLLALAASGCILTSGQFMVSYDLGTVNITSPSAVVGVQVDLNEEDDYNEHKEDIKALADEALLGYVKNNKAEPLKVQIWLTPTLTTYTTDADVRANGVLAWGPLDLGPQEQLRVSWDRSAELLTAEGKQLLEQEVKGDGSFTVYVVGAAGDYSLTVTSGKLLAIIDAGI
jgi:hypothetical protein